MAQLARADLESLLRARRLDRTLTTALPPIDPHDEYAIGPSGVTTLDAALGGGFPRGQLSELVGPRSSGCTSLLLRLLAAATARGECVALVDALDMLDVESAAAAGVDLERLLWVRGHVVPNPGLCRDLNQRALAQAIRAFTLVLQAGQFGLVVLDLAEASPDAVRRLPFTTWLRLQRLLEGSQTMGVLVGNEPMARSSAGLTIKVGVGVGVGMEMGMELEMGDQGSDTQRTGASVHGAGAESRFRGRLFEGLNVDARVSRARARGCEHARLMLSTEAHADV